MGLRVRVTGQKESRVEGQDAQVLHPRCRFALEGGEFRGLWISGFRGLEASGSRDLGSENLGLSSLLLLIPRVQGSTWWITRGSEPPTGGGGGFRI